jgi:flagellar hook-associated protein 2
MGRIQSTVGLASGIDIGGTIDKLMAVAAQPRDGLTAANKTLNDKETGLTALAALLSSVEYVSDNLGKEDLYQQRTVTSNNPGALAVTMTGNPAVGNYNIRPCVRRKPRACSVPASAPTASPLEPGP